MLPADRYEVATAQDGFQALEEFDRFHPDLVFLRTMLPKKHGFQVCQEMVERAGSRYVPVVMHCSIYKSRKYRSDAMKIYGAAEYLEDPIEEKTLEEVLDRFLVKAPPAVPVKPAAPEPAAPPPPPAPAAPAPAAPPAPVSTAPAPPAARPAPPRPKGGLSGVDKALEETLSGLKLDVKKHKVSSVEATVPLGTIPPPPPPAPPATPAAPPAAPAGPPEGTAPQEEVTSEDLFGDVIQDVLEAPKKPEEKAAPPTPEAPKAEEKPAPPREPMEAAPAPEPVPPAAPKAEEKPAPPPEPAEPAAAPPEPTVRMTVPPAVPKEARKAPAIDLDKALGSTLQGIAGLEDSTVRRLKAKSESELSKKLEETLSGVKLGAPRHAEPVPPPAASPAPPAQAAAPPPPVAKAPEAPEAKPAAPPPAPAEEAPKVSPELEKTPTKEGVPFGNYLLIDKIAVGGMAELFKARQNGLEGFKRIVAIKRILPHLAANQEFVTMFTDEAKLAAQLNHPNIGHIYDLGKLEDSYFIAMEYVDGRDLRTILKELDSRQARMPLRVAVYIAQKVCAALHYAHTAKDVDGKPMDLVHRDVSPQNIILSTTGEVKLVDFGIAKAASKASHTQSGALKGKLLYMSPEQAWGKTINHQADIFALGAVLWEMLTGRKLFYGDSEMSILEKVREAKVEPPRKYREEIPEELERIVLKALEKDLGSRYATCQAMQADLEHFAYEEWETLPSAYDAAAFLNGFFPNVYTREILSTLKKEPEGPPQEARPSRPGKPPKSQRGKPAPPPKKEKAAEAPPPPAPEPPKAAAPRPAPPKPEPRAAEPPKAPPPPPPPAKGVEETTGSRMFGDVVEKPEGSKKTLLVAGGAAAALVVILILVFALRGKKPPAPPPEPAPAPAAAQTKEPEPQPAPAPPPVVQTPAPIPPAAGAAQATEAEIAAARRTATAAFTAFSKSVTDLEQAGAGQYVPDSLHSLKQSQSNLQALLRRARTPEEFKAAEDGSRQGEALAAQVKTQLGEAKAAAEREAARKAAEAEAAKKAQEEAAKKAAEEEAQKQAQAGKVKPGDFVDLWAVDVKPRETQKVPVAYTPQARQNKIQGTVYVEVAISETGQVTSATVVRGLKPDYGLHDACVKAALETRYSPAIKDGVPVKTKMTYPVVFKIQ